MKRISGIALLFLLLSTSIIPSIAGPLEIVPEPLRPWVSWVLHDDEEYGCPPQYNSAESKRCVWAGRLELQLAAKGGSFKQTAKAYRKSWFALPGDAKRWPQNVTLDGAAAVVVPKDDLPGIWLPPGEHTLAGSFVWAELPEKLTLAHETALIALSLNGKAVTSPFVDDSGLLWLTQRTAQGAASGPVGLRVFRLVEDGVPVTLTTRLAFEASANSEAVYGPVLPPGATPLALHSTLPARLEANGAVRVQLRPGQWEITLVSRLAGPISELARSKTGGNWPEEEVWSFAAQPKLRVVTPSGPDAVDPQQTDVPPEWKAYPAFRMRGDDKLKLAETRRGDPLPEPDRLNLVRRLWLDFDGAGYSVEDKVSGAMSRHWRLEMEPPFMLGRAALDGSDQLITRLDADTPAGIELRRGSLSLAADSRVESGVRSLPVTGWKQDFQSVSAELNLPAGWRLITASGVDRAQGAWTAQWSLLDFFLVLVAALAVRHLWGDKWAAVMLVMLALTWHEPGAPRWVWLALLTAVALMQALPEGKLRMAARWARHVLLLALVMISLPFAVGQIRQAIYPVLEHPHEQVMTQKGEPQMAAAPALAPMAERARDNLADYDEAKPEEMNEGMLSSVSGYAKRADKPEYKLAKKSKFNMFENDPKAVVQTGPGLPRWNWNSYRLQWSGPVEHTQTMTLWLTSPAVNALLDFVRVALLALAALCIAGIKLPRLRLPLRGLGAAYIVVGALMLMPHESWASSPVAPPEVKVDAEMLKELKQRLTAPADCHPGCAEISRMAIDASGSTLTLRLAVGAVIDTAIALPGKQGQWQPRQVLLDGRPGVFVRDEQGLAWMLVGKGAHQILLEGALADNQVLGLPMKPRLVTEHASGYRIEGVDAAGVPADALRISALGTRAAAREQQRGQVPSFVRIERTFELGLRWQMLTRIERVSTDTAPVSIELPLLEGETVISEGVRSVKGHVQAVLPAQAGSMEWRSTLTQREVLQLESAKQNAWVEVWRFDTGALWHVEFDGLVPVHHQSEGRWLPEWRPWQGEMLKARITRPEGVAGRALTIDGAALEVKPGLRTMDTELNLTLRSSRGGEHAILLPEGAELLGASINGMSQPLRLEKNALRIPVLPGAQQVVLNWREPRGISTLFRTPEVKLNAPGVNASVQLRVPSGRWMLWLSGPRMGPAILFWGALLALVPIAFVLARVQLVPLAARDWFLLGLGLTQSHVAVSVIIVAWFFALAVREKRADALSNKLFNLSQIVLAGLTVIAFALLVLAVRHSLLGTPEMQITGNGSSAWELNWYQDRTVDVLPEALVVSVPLLVYRLAMLAWSLWLAIRLIGWIKWGWNCFAAGGYWRRIVHEKKA